jgi:hypothetical protein
VKTTPAASSTCADKALDEGFVGLRAGRDLPDRRGRAVDDREEEPRRAVSAVLGAAADVGPVSDGGERLGSGHGGADADG